MDIKQQILHRYRVNELSIREIARKTGADGKAVTLMMAVSAFQIRMVALDVSTILAALLLVNIVTFATYASGNAIWSGAWN